jgi:hypothetical protein
VIDISIDPYRCRSSSSQGEKLGDLFFPSALESYQYISGDFKRGTLDCNQSYSQLIDVHANYRAKIFYLRLTAEGEPKTTTISSRANVTRTAHRSDFGSLLCVVHYGTQYTVWLPLSGGQFRFDDHGRINASQRSGLSYEWSSYPQVGLKIFQRGEPGERAVFPYVVLEDPEGEYFGGLSSLSDSETRLYRKSDWFFASAPVDLWSYLISGSLYDPRSWKGVDKRFKCQQCAFAWWNYFDFLQRKTGKKLYSLLRDEVAYSVLLDLSPQGEWGHGYWSDEIETHARFHLDGIHLLLSQYENTGASIWLEAAERGMAFIFDHLMDTLDDGCPWFLHDTLEEKSNKHRFKSTLFGKSSGNSLCINTHVQALTVLHRLSLLTEGKPIYADRLERGAASLRRVLDYQPGEPFYRFLAFMLTRCFQSLAKNDLLRNRIHRGVYWRVTLMIYWWLKRLVPRLVLPQGFIERDLTLSVAADDYHNTNLKDLLTLYQQVPYPWLRPYIKNGFAFERDMIQTLGLSQAVARSPYYFEFVDILKLYDSLIEPLPAEETALAEDVLYKSTGGCSLDYHASELVRPRKISAEI